MSFFSFVFSPLSAFHFGSFGTIGRFGTSDDDFLARLFGGRTFGGDGDDTILGGFGNDIIRGGDGDDLIRARTGHDTLNGGEGNDDLRAGRGDDVLNGGSGDDHLKGGSGADEFLFNPNNPDEGDDTIKDLDIEAGDRIVLNAADVLRSAPDVASASPFGDPGAVEGADLDKDPAWTIGESPDGFVVVGHPGGTITIEGLPFDPELTFDDLLPAIEIANAQVGDANSDHLFGGRSNDLLDGGAGNDDVFGRRGDDFLIGGAGNDDLFGGRGNDLLDGGTGNDELSGGRGDDDLIGGSGNDELRGGHGADRFFFDPSNPDEGTDIIEDFNVGEDLLALSAADIAKSTPEILSALAARDTSSIADAGALLTALDGSAAWSLFGADGTNNLTVGHPGGTIEFDGIGFADQTFVGLAGLFDASELNLQNGDNGDDTLTGERGDDLLNGEAGSDLLIGGSGDDLLVGGEGADRYRFDPSNGNEGDDLIADFSLLDGDKIQLAAADVVASLEPDLTMDALQLTDLDDSANWGFFADEGGDATITHTGGTITLAGLGTDLLGVTSFEDLSGAIELI